MVSASDRVKIQGKYIDRLTYERYVSINLLVRSSRYGSEKSDISVIQAIGGAKASGGTHATGGSLDYTAFNQANRVYADRLFGGAAWFRPARPGVWQAHCHSVTSGVDYAAASARQQVTAYQGNRNGLANNAQDDGPRLGVFPLFVAPWTERGARGVYYTKSGTSKYSLPRTDKKAGDPLPVNAKFTVIGVVNVKGVLWAINTEGYCVPKASLTTTVPAGQPTAKAAEPAPAPPPAPVAPVKKMSARFGHYNVPGPDKYKNASLRAKAAAALCKAQNLDAITFNELEGKTSSGPSAFAKELLAAFGKGYSLITPTTVYNENYIIYKKSAFSLVKQPGDAKIYVDNIPGRHLTQSILKDRETGKEVFLGVTHLINNNEDGAAKQAPAVWAAANKSRGGRPAFIFGDMNTDRTLTGFTHAGLHNARLHTKATTTSSHSTFVGWTATTPKRVADKIIDHLYVPAEFEVNGYTVVLDVDSAGKFNQPRPSDHLLVIISVTEL